MGNPRAVSRLPIHHIPLHVDALAVLSLESMLSGPHRSTLIVTWDFAVEWAALEPCSRNVTGSNTGASTE